MPDLKPWQWAGIIALLAVLNIAVLGGLLMVVITYDLWTSPVGVAANPTVPPGATSTATRRPTFTATFTPEVWPTPIATRIPTQTLPPTATWTPLPTHTVLPTPTRAPTETPTVMPSPTFSPSATPTRTAVPTRTPRPTWTPMPEASPERAIAALPPSASLPLPSATRTPTPTPTRIPTQTPTPIPSATYTRLPSPTPSPTPEPTATITQHAEPVSAADWVTQVSAVEVAEDDLEAALVADASVNLTWQPDSKAARYRIYSDMGTGLGVFLLKAEVEQRTFGDVNLRPATRYCYRVTAVTRKGETLVAGATATTPRRAAAVNAAEVSVPVIPTRVSLEVTPAPTPLPPDTVILGMLSASDYVGEVDGQLVIVGEVRNDSHLDVSDAAVTATFYDPEGQASGELVGQTVLKVLAAGARSPFIVTMQEPTQGADYSLRATGRPSVSSSREVQLKVVSTRRYEDDAGFYHVAGVIENTSRRRAHQVRVVVVLYDRGGNVVNVGIAYPTPASMPRGDRADFDVAFTYYPKVISHAAMALAD